MSGVRDPAFWKRFSMAVHLDEERGDQGQADAKHSNNDSWLSRQQRKKSKRTKICWIFWICFTIVIGTVIGVIAWLGAFDGFSFDGNTSSSSAKFRRAIQR